MDWAEIALRLLLAAGAGMLIGIDRQLRHRPAGLRTHMLVALGAAAALMIPLQLQVDEARVIQGVVTGIGFIGGGTILHARTHVEGVTTAASIWASTMIGLAAGGGLYRLVVLTTVLALLILGAGIPLERVLARWQKQGEQP